MVSNTNQRSKRHQLQINTTFLPPTFFSWHISSMHLPTGEDEFAIEQSVNSTWEHRHNGSERLVKGDALPEQNICYRINDSRPPQHRSRGTLEVIADMLHIPRVKRSTWTPRRAWPVVKAVGTWHIRYTQRNKVVRVLKSNEAYVYRYWV